MGEGGGPQQGGWAREGLPTVHEEGCWTAVLHAPQFPGSYYISPEAAAHLEMTALPVVETEWGWLQHETSDFAGPLEPYLNPQNQS